MRSLLARALMSYRDITASQLFELLRYSPTTGKLYWRERSVSVFTDGVRQSAASKAATWNKKHAEKPALTAIGSHGYRCGDVLGFPVLAHRVILCMLLGHWPVMSDHENGDRLNNTPDNLREIFSDSENSMNRAIQSNNRSGFHGISWDKGRLKWRVHAKGKYVGVYPELDAAVAARAEVSASLGFHQNHGRIQQWQAA